MHLVTAVIVQWSKRLWHDCRGQDMIEYALVAASVAVACGAILPPVVPSISVTISKVTSFLNAAP